MSRILLKLSGEALLGNHEKGLYDQSVLLSITDAIRSFKDAGHQILLVVGGGNLFRGGSLSLSLGLERSTADYIGMLATIQNALVLRDYFNSKGLETRVSSAIAMPQVCEPYLPKKVQHHLEKGRVVIFAAGIGSPYFTTDTTAVQRALELSVERVIYLKNGVDALYTADPNKDPSATRIESIRGTEVVERGLRGLDLAAIALARDNKLPIRVIGMSHLHDALETDTGTTIIPE